MFDLGKAPIDIKCSCGITHKATLQDTINRRTIRCSCGTGIRLQDNGSVRTSVADIDRSMKDLEKALKKLGK